MNDISSNSKLSKPIFPPRGRCRICNCDYFTINHSISSAQLLCEHCNHKYGFHEVIKFDYSKDVKEFLNCALDKVNMSDDHSQLSLSSQSNFNQISEQILRFLYFNFPGGCLILNTCGHLIDMSENFLSLIGASNKDSLMGSSWLDKVFYSQDKDIFLSSLAKHAETKNSFDLTIRFVHQITGKILCVRGSYLFQSAPNSDLPEIIGIIVDLTSQKKLEKSLQHSQTELNQILDTSTSYIIRSLTNGITKYASRNWLSRFNINARNVHDFRNLIHPDDRERIQNQYEHDLNTPFTDITETQFRVCNQNQNAEEELYWFLCRRSPIYINGKYDGFVCVIIDISSFKKIESDILMSEARFHSISNYTFDLEFAFDANDIITCFSQHSFERMSGHDSQEFSFKLFCELITPDDREKYLNHFNLLRTMKHDGQGIKTNFHLHRKSGEIRYLEAMCFPLYSSSSKYIGHRESIHDNTENILLEVKIENDHQQRLESISNFLRRLSHDIRNPLTGVMGSLYFIQIGIENISKLLSKSGSLTENFHKDINTELVFINSMLNAMNECNIYQKKLLDDTLLISRIEENRFCFVQKPFNIKSATISSIEIVKTVILEKKLELKVDIPDVCNVFVLGDEYYFQSILINLLNNSIKFTPKGYISITLKAHSLSEKDIFFQISIADSGVGFTEHEMQNLFQKFPTTFPTSFFISSGLGLYISKELLNLMGGDIKVMTKQHYGSEFIISIKFPLTQTKNEILPVTIEQKKELIKKLSVLIVEDERILQKLASFFFKQIGNVFGIAKNGEEGINMCKREKFDVIVTDWLMPKKTGVELIEEVRTRKTQGWNENSTDAKVKIIMLTGMSDKEDIDLAYKYGADRVLVKPISWNEMDRIIIQLFPEQS